MARLTILLALTALMLLAAHASARKQEEEQSRCERELEDVNLRHCEQHIMQRIQRDEGEDEDEENVLKMRGIKNHNHHKRNPMLRKDYHLRCCSELRELKESPECLCEALQQIRENQSEELKKDEETKRLDWELWNLPQSCGLRTPWGCDFSGQQEN